MGNRMEGPSDRARSNVVRANVAGSGALTFSDARALDEQVPEDHAGTRGHEVRVADVPRETRGKIDGPRIAECANRTAATGVERVQSAAGREQDSPVSALGPIDDAAVDVRLA